MRPDRTALATTQQEIKILGGLKDRYTIRDYSGAQTLQDMNNVE